MESRFSKLNKLVASAQLPPKLRTVADYVINNLDTCRFLTANELAKTANVSYSTVIRLAATLGFSGYPDFQKFLRSAFDDNLESISDNIVVPSQRIDEIIARGTTPRSTTSWPHMCSRIYRARLPIIRKHNSRRPAKSFSRATRSISCRSAAALRSPAS